MDKSVVTVSKETTALAISLIAFGHERGLTFHPMDFRGVPEEPFGDGEYVYRLARQMPADFEMPMKAWRRFFAVYEDGPVPIKDVIIGEELEPYKEWTATMEASKKATIATGTALATVGAGILTLLTMVPMALLVDPQLIVVLDTPDQEWVCIAEWL